MTIRSYNIPQQVTSVRLVATSNLAGSYYNGILGNGIGATLTALSNGVLTVDGVNPIQSDRILLANQINTNENGIYDVTSPGSASSHWILRRSPDYQSLEQIKLGQYFSVDAGVTLAGNMFVLVEPLPANIGGIGLGGMNFIDVSTGGSSSGGPFLRIAKNLSDVQSLNTSYNNFGLGGGTSLTLRDSDFFLGTYQLTNPCPNIITLDCTALVNTLILPPANGPEAFGLYQGPYIFNIGTQRVNINSFTGVPQTPSIATSAYHFLLTDNSTSGGLWDAMGIVTDILGQTGSVSLIAGANMDIAPNDDGTITLSALSGPGAVDSGQCNFFTINISNRRTTFSGSNTPTPILVDSLTVLFQNNFDATLVSNTPDVQILTNATRQCLINANIILSTSSAFQQTFSVYLKVINGSMSVVTGKIASITIPVGVSPQEISLTYNLALTGPTNHLQFLISNDSTTTDPVTAVISSVTILDTTQFGGFSSTDVLPQGVTNLYLSTNGGSTYQNVNGLPVTVGNIASFNTTGGKLQDSGVAVSSLVLPSTTVSGALSGFVLSPLLSSIGIGQVVAITTVSATSYVMGDNAPINRYVLQNSSLTTFTLPISASVTIGHVFEVYGCGSATYNIGQNSGQSIKTSAGGVVVSTTVGTSGFLQASNITDCVKLVYAGSGVFIISDEQTSGSGIILN